MSNTRHYCTYFDRRYLSRGLALYESLRRNSPRQKLHVLCMDEQTYDYLAAANLDGMHPIRLSELELWDPALPAIKSSRSLVEYYFTCAPELVLYVMSIAADAQDVTYLDADLYFYQDPAPIFKEVGSGSIGIIEHRFPPERKDLEIFGVFNVGFLFFRCDSEGRRCLEWWRDRCLEWCFDKVEPGKFADQKYLDQWPTLFQGVVIIQNEGAGLAPWNQSRFPISLKGGTICSGGEPLIFYHFHGLRLPFRRVSTHGLANYGGRLTPCLKSKIYVPYIRELRSLQKQINAVSAPDIRYSRPYGFLRVVRWMIDETVIVTMGRFAVEVRLAAVVHPLKPLYKKGRRLFAALSRRPR